MTEIREATDVATLIAVRATEDMKLHVLGGPYGLDRRGQEFDASTDFGDLPIVPVIYYHGWGSDGGERIGWAAKAERNTQGQWYDVTLDATKAQARKIYEDAQKGLVRASSDAIAHLVRPMEALKGMGGKIQRWIIGALSLMDAATYDQAINPRAIALPAVRAYLDELFNGLAHSGEAPAAMAGATFARRNRERIAAIQKMLDEMKGEFPIEEESGVLPSSDPPQAVTGIKAMEPNQEQSSTTPPAVQVAQPVTQTPPPQAQAPVSQTPAQQFTATTTPQIDVASLISQSVTAAVKAQNETVNAAVKAALDAQMAEWDKQVTATNRPKWAGGAPMINKGELSVDDVAAKAFNQYAKSGNPSGYGEWADKARDEAYKIGDESKFPWAVKAALNEGTTSAGGYLVPNKYSNELTAPLTRGSIIRAAGAKVLTVDGTLAFKVPTLANSTKAILTAEAAGYSEVEPTFGEVTFVPYKYTRLTKASEEVLSDSRLDVMSQVFAPDVANAFILAENDAFVLGTGSSQPHGIKVAATLGVTTAATNAITAEELMDLEHSIAEQYRAGSCFVMADATLKMVRKLRENGTTGDFLLKNGIAGSLVPTLLGYPVYTVLDMPAATTGLIPIVFGNFSFFSIGDFSQLYFQRLNELYSGTGEVGFRWFKRFDSHLMLAAAFRSLKIA